MSQGTNTTVLVLLSCFLLILAPASAYTRNNIDENILKTFTYRELGPARQGGRVLDIEVPGDDPHTFYVATASGGLWKTMNNGTTFEPLFQNQNTIAIGDLAIAPSNPDILWIGTGTPASCRITLRGDGIYKSTDGGFTWEHMGLEETIHIGRIAIHPQDPDTVYVAALGYHFSFNEERGLYKTTNGGRSWNKVLFISSEVGVVDVAIDPSHPDVVYAVSYDKWRFPWHFEEGGPESGIYKSTDAGKTWRRLGGGLPGGKIGRIGIEIFPENTNILYASIENSNLVPPTEDEIREYQSIGRPPIGRKVGREVYRSDDGGMTWTKMNSDQDVLRGGKWYGEIRVDPNNENIVYLPSVSLLRSTDGGRTWGRNGPRDIARSVHVDHHDVWINPENSGHLIEGNDGGISISYDGGVTWDVYENLPVAQFYTVGVDMEEPYNIYGGTQDCGSVKIPSNSMYGIITREDWSEVGGGDGMYNQIDPEDSRWLYNDYQLGAIQRVDQKLGTWTSLSPEKRGENDPPLRFNWNSPIQLSPHNSKIVYFGANVLLRSLNRGEDWVEISPDLTTQDPWRLQGNIEFCTITTISESPITPGIIWVGTDDGKVQLTRDGGAHWNDITANLETAGAPGEFYVSRVFASHFNPGTAYAAKTGFQRDDYDPFLFKTTDFGASWSSIAGNLSKGIIHVIVEDHKNPDLLFVGKEMGVYVSVDGGEKWHALKNNMPTNAVHDLLIHPRDNDLVVGTYGRGIFVTDISPLQEMTKEVREKDVFLFSIEPKIQWIYKRRGRLFGDRHFIAPNEPYGLVIYYYLKRQYKTDITIKINDSFGDELARLTGPSEKGINRVVWDMRKQPTQEEIRSFQSKNKTQRLPRGDLVYPGEYVVSLEANGRILTRKALIRKPPDRED